MSSTFGFCLKLHQLREASSSVLCSSEELCSVLEVLINTEQGIGVFISVSIMKMFKHTEMQREWCNEPCP